MSDDQDDASWSLQDGIQHTTWPDEIRQATGDLRQGLLVRSPPLLYAASATFPVHATTRAWAGSAQAGSGAVNVVNPARRPPYGVIATQTCDLVEEGKPKRPWLQIAPAYWLPCTAGDQQRIEQARGFDYFCPVTALPAGEGGLWVADLRILIPVEKGWLAEPDRNLQPAFTDEGGFDRFAAQLARRFARPAYPTAVNRHILAPLYKLLGQVGVDYEGRDPIVDVGLALGRSRLDPTNVQVVFLLERELEQALRARLVDWWEEVSGVARDAGLAVLAPRFVTLDELTAREYRQLDFIDAASLSPSDEQLDNWG